MSAGGTTRNSARAGSTGDFGGTGILDQMGWYVENSTLRTHFVALKEANDWGLYDMHGNVREWINDYYQADYYGVSPTDDPQGPATGPRRVIRGGGPDSNASECRSASRASGFPQASGIGATGFRLARNQ